MIYYSTKEIREELLPLVCAIRLGLRKCNNSLCFKSLKRMEDWLGNIWIREKASDLHGIQIQLDNWAER